MRARPLRASGARPPAGHRRTTLLYHVARPAAAACRFTPLLPLAFAKTAHTACRLPQLRAGLLLVQRSLSLASAPHPVRMHVPPAQEHPDLTRSWKKTMKIAVTGAAGQISNHLVRGFSAQQGWAGRGGHSTKPQAAQVFCGVGYGHCTGRRYSMPLPHSHLPRSCSCLPAARCLVGTSPLRCSCLAATAVVRRWRAWPWSWRTGGGLGAGG